MRVIKRLKELDGVVLVLVMITLMVVALLGSAAVAVSISENKQSHVMDKDMRAYYLAHSAADATITNIKKQIIALNEMSVTTEEGAAAYAAAVAELEQVVPADPGPINSSSSVDGIGNGDDKKVDSVQVWRDGLYIYVKATATVESVSSSATVRLNQEEASPSSYTISETTPATTYTAGLFDDAIYAAGKITIDGRAYNIKGNVSCGGTLEGSTSGIDGTLTQNKSKTFADWNVPSSTDFSHTPAWSSSGMTISTNAKYTSSVTMNANYTINTGSGNDIILDFTNVTIGNNNTIEALGTGRVFIFADNMILGNKVSFLSDQANPFIYVIVDKNSTSTLTLGGIGEWDAYIYAPTIAVDATHGTPDIYGSVICNTYTGKGNFKVTYRKSNLDEEDFDGGSSTPTTNTESRTFTRIGKVGKDGTQWLKE